MQLDGLRNGRYGRRLADRRPREPGAAQSKPMSLKIELNFKQLQEELGYRFKDPALLVRALTHVSYDRQKSEGHNEVLEFLGDAVLDLAVSDLLDTP